MIGTLRDRFYRYVQKLLAKKQPFCNNNNLILKYLRN